MIGGNEANLALVGYEPEKVKQLAKLAHELGVLIHIDGMPFGDATSYLNRPEVADSLSSTRGPATLGNA